MKSLKNIIGTIIITLLIILIILIAFNVFYINDLTHKLYETHYLIGEIKENYLEMDLPIRVLKNISSQDIESMDETRFNNIIDANNRNTSLLKELVEKNNQLILKSKIMISDYRNSNIFRYFGLFEDNYKSIHIIEERFNRMNDLVEKCFFNETVNNKNFSSITNEYEAVKPIIDNTINDFDRNIINIMDLYIQTNNVLIGIMGLIVLILLFLLYRIGKIDLTYIIKAFSQMNQQDFQSQNLPAFNPKFLEENEIESIIHQVMQEQDFLQKIKVVTSRGYLLTEVIDNLFEMIEEELHIDRVGVAFVNYKDEEIIAEYGIANYEKILLGSGFNVSFSSTSLYELIENPKTLITNDLETLYENKTEGSALSLILREGVQSNIVFPLIIDQSVFGFLFFSSVNKNQFNEKTKQIGENIAREIAGILDKTYLTKMIFSKITIAFADLVEKKDTETGEHLDRMVEYSRFITQLLINHPSQEYCVTSKFVREIVNNAPVHDIGKVAIPDKILKKPGKLDASEWEIMKTHPSVGADIFSDLKKSLEIFNHGFYTVAENITRYHHEKWNGKGYPEGLTGSEIPLEARIVAIADVFDALTSKRVYKDEFNFEKAWLILEESSGEHFDPELIRLLKSKKEEFRKFYLKLH
jgi:HD-GYP domain-containing protein (c-di-GMP phosphodiesterase class II)